ncbi:MAG: hypothetical protein IT577_01120 [Verrucomicrobiae bacterium]|nr:hypothetical protein [Verrucomicrobiae bacterium]
MRRAHRNRIGYFGLPGSFTHEVAQRSYARDELLPFHQMASGFEQLRAAEMDRIVVPFENSVGGAVPDTLDQLILLENWESVFTIVGQMVYAIELCLMSRAGPGHIRRIYSHFVPLQVVRGWLEREYPAAETIVVGSTSAAAEQAAEDEAGAAVGNAAAAGVYGLRLVARNLVPPSINVTRFLEIGLAGGRRAGRRGGPERAMVHLRLANRPGALADVLMALKRKRVNMTQLLSRPVQGQLGQYQFLVEMDVPAGMRAMDGVWRALGKKTSFLHVLGQYPVRWIGRRVAG